jgi:hypothetical protein
MLDRAVPSRLLAAFPKGVPVERVPLTQATEAIARFLVTLPYPHGASPVTGSCPGALLHAGDAMSGG